MDKWKLTIEDMGPAWKQQDLETKAADLLRDYTLLTAAGADHVTVLEHMKGGYQELVTQAMITGSAIPENMKPAIQTLIDMGELTDDAGNKLTDVGQLNWAQPISDMFKDLIGKIDDLVDALNYRLTGAIKNLPDHTVHIGVQTDPLPDLGNAYNGDGYSRGGIIGGAQYFAGGGMARGTDTIPAWLTPGEMVLTNSQQKAIGALLRHGGGSSAGGGETVVHTNLVIDGRVLAKLVERHRDNALRGRRKLRAA